MDALTELEQRVTRKWLAEAAARVPGWGDDPLNVGQWMVEPVQPLPDDVLQFPREQWASYPAKRTATLIACEELLDCGTELTDEQWEWLCMAMQYGGKTRLT